MPGPARPFHLDQLAGNPGPDRPGARTGLIARGPRADVEHMRFNPQLGVVHITEDTSGRRRSGRLRQEEVWCNLGQVKDLSSSGMRVIGKHVPKKPVITRIMGPAVEVTVSGEVKWSKRLGFRKHEMGVEFIEVTPELAEALTSLGVVNRRRSA